MSRESEKFMKQLQKYLDENDTGDLTDEEFNELTDRFFAEHQGETVEAGPLKPEDAKTSDDFLELAEDNQENAQLCRKYAEKALALDPDNLDAELLLTDLNYPRDGSPEKRLDRDEEVVAKGREIMARLGVRDGNYWVDVTTRPFMRALERYAMDCYYYGMHRKSMALMEEMLVKNPDDSQAVRWTLIVLYMVFEEEEKAEKLLAAYTENGDESALLLGMADLKFRLGKFDEAKSFLQRLLNVNPGTKKFFRTVCEDSRELRSYRDMPFLKPFTLEELASSYENAIDLYDSSFAFFLWGNKALSGMKAQKKAK